MDRPPPFTVRVTRLGRGLVVAPTGEIDLGTSDQVRQAALGAGTDQPVLVLDLREVEFLDTSGLQVLLQCRGTCEEQGREFAVVRGPAGVQRLLDISGVSRIVPLVDTPEQAVAGTAG